MAYEDFKDLPRRTAFENVLQDKAFKLSSDPKYDWYQWRLALMVYYFFEGWIYSTSSYRNCDFWESSIG